MIKGIYSGGRYMQVNNGQPGTPSVYNNNAGSSNGSQSFTGQLRYNSSASGLEVFDGNMWQRMDSSVAQVGLNSIAEEALDWVRQKMQEEKDMYERMKRHPGLRDAYEKFKIMDALTLEQESGAESEEAAVQAGP